jgi:hypothetical protein
MCSAAYEVADVLIRNHDKLKDYCSNSWQLRTLYAIEKCRTSALGGHIDKCDHISCQKLHLSYNSCRNRHCPKCQGQKKEMWIQKREDELFNTSYFHVVFTLPDSLNRLCLYAPKEVYSILFKTAWSVLQDFGNKATFLGAQTGMIGILHTWGQNLSLHPHLHCIVPGGGITKSGKWKTTRNKGKYLYPVKEMSKVFRARFVAHLRKEFKEPQTFYDQLFQHHWVVYAKQTFYGPQQVIEYLGRYTHKIAISNHRIKAINNDTVTFSVKDYRKGGKKGIQKLSHKEFIRRFSMHILPRGFVRIRHYGLLSTYHKKRCIPLLQKQLGRPILKPKESLLHRICPICKKGKLLTIFTFNNRGPPKDWIEKLSIQNKQSKKQTTK